MFQNIRNIKHNLLLSMFISILVFSVSACSRVEFISHYDEATDIAVTALQRKTETHFVMLDSIQESPECKYVSNKQFYNEAKVDVSAIIVRASAIPKNNKTIKQTELLSRSLDNLSKLHKISCLSKSQIDVLRTQFNVIFTAILKLEFAKRRGR